MLYYTAPIKTAFPLPPPPPKLKKRSYAGVWLTSWKRSWSVWKSQLLTAWPSRARLLRCYGADMTLAVLRGRRARVFPCAWPLLPPPSCWTSQLASEVFIPLFSLQIPQIFCVHTVLDDNFLTKHHHLCGHLVLLSWSVRTCGVDWRELLTWTAEVRSMAWCCISLSTCAASPDLHQQQAATEFWMALNYVSFRS